MLWQVFEMLGAGVQYKEILEAFPSLSKEHIIAALKYSADIARGKENVIVNVPFEN
jgi:uncharacterized protein (DUF433 family)